MPAHLFWDSTHTPPHTGPLHTPTPVWPSPLKSPAPGCLPPGLLSSSGLHVAGLAQATPSMGTLTKDQGLPKPLPLLCGPHSQPEGQGCPCTAPGLAREASLSGLLDTGRGVGATSRQHPAGHLLASSPPQQTPAEADSLPDTTLELFRAGRHRHQGCARLRPRKSVASPGGERPSCTHGRARKRRENVVSKGP